MITISEKIYRAVAEILLKEIDGKDFYNGTVEYNTDEYHSRFKATLIIYRDKEKGCQTTAPIRDIIPVWWEFHMDQPQGEALSDFCWRELKNNLI